MNTLYIKIIDPRWCRTKQSLSHRTSFPPGKSKGDIEGFIKVLSNQEVTRSQ